MLTSPSHTRPYYTLQRLAASCGSCSISMRCPAALRRATPTPPARLLRCLLPAWSGERPLSPPPSSPLPTYPQYCTPCHDSGQHQSVAPSSVGPLRPLAAVCCACHACCCCPNVFGEVLDGGGAGNDVTQTCTESARPPGGGGWSEVCA
jgi:hypothetical protein